MGWRDGVRGKGSNDSWVGKGWGVSQAGGSSSSSSELELSMESDSEFSSFSGIMGCFGGGRGFNCRGKGFVGCCLGGKGGGLYTT